MNHERTAIARRYATFGTAIFAFVLAGCSSPSNGTDPGSDSAEEGTASAGEVRGGKLSGDEVNRIKAILSKQGEDGTKAHALSSVNTDDKSQSDALTQDSKNALYAALVYDNTKDPTYAAWAVRLLKAWATQHPTFSGHNDFLASAWCVGAQARAAQILKADQAPGYAKIAGTVEAWFVSTAESYWLPRGDKAPANTKPELLNSWEWANVTNRTAVSLEATMHVARLIGDGAWSDKAADLYATKFIGQYVHDDGSNEDNGRTGQWHQQAGLASGVAICMLATHASDWGGTNRNLWEIQGGKLRKSIEHYAPLAGGDSIPFWAGVVAHWGKDKVPNAAKVVANGIDLKNGPLDYSWGFDEYL